MSNLKEKTAKLIDTDHCEMVRDVNNYLKQIKDYDEKKTDVVSCAEYLKRLA